MTRPKKQSTEAAVHGDPCRRHSPARDAIEVFTDLMETRGIRVKFPMNDEAAMRATASLAPHQLAAASGRGACASARRCRSAPCDARRGKGLRLVASARPSPARPRSRLVF